VKIGLRMMLLGMVAATALPAAASVLYVFRTVNTATPLPFTVLDTSNGVSVFSFTIPPPIPVRCSTMIRSIGIQRPTYTALYFGG